MNGGDEAWPNYFEGNTVVFTDAYIGYGFQTGNNPYLNFWDGENGGKALWRGIHDCNSF